MKALDRLLQRWRIKKAGKYIPHGARVLDIGCHQGELFHILRDLDLRGVGIDPEIKENTRIGSVDLYRGTFPTDEDINRPFDVITILAVLEHIPEGEVAEFAAACATNLKDDGSIIITVPALLVDRILAVLVRLRLIDGMSVDEHHGFQPEDVSKIFLRAGFTILERSKFQLGQNNLFVLQKST